jgi:hypothetical protein
MSGLEFIVRGQAMDTQALLANAERVIRQWDENTWRARNAPQRVAKPFAVPGSADLCAAMAVKAGWTHVAVVEVITGKK